MGLAGTGGYRRNRRATSDDFSSQDRETGCDEKPLRRCSGPIRLVVEFRAPFVSDPFLLCQIIYPAVSSCVELLRPLRELRPLHKLSFRWCPRLQDFGDGFDV
jgi:hypothetical protein